MLSSTGWSGPAQSHTAGTNTTRVTAGVCVREGELWDVIKLYSSSVSPTSLTHTHPLAHSLPHTLPHTHTHTLPHSLSHTLPHTLPHTLTHSQGTWWLLSRILSRQCDAGEMSEPAFSVLLIPDQQ